MIVAVSPAAVAEIIRVTTGMRGWVVRVQTTVAKFNGPVPSHFQNFVDIDTHVDPETDYFDDSQGVPVVVDRRTAELMSGFLLDWRPVQGGRDGFSLRGPNDPR